MITTALCCLLASLPQDPGPTVGPSPDEASALALESLANGFGYRLEPLPDLGHVALWLGVRVGYDHDPPGRTGLARVVAAALARELGPAAPERPVETVVLGTVTFAGVVVPLDAVDRELARLARWVGGRPELDDDALLRARGEALLRADDELSVLPGPVLRWRARRATFAGEVDGRQGAGLPDEMRELSPDAVRTHLRRAFGPDRAFLIAVGGFDPERLRTRVSDVFGALAAGDQPPPEPVAHDSGPEAGAVAAHDRVDAPFVVAAFRAPRWGEADFLPFLIAVEVLRGRAARTFKGYRGGELKAEFPWVAFNYLRGDRLAFVERRGREGDDVERVRTEITSLCAGLRVGGATAREIGAAGLSLRGVLDLPPYGERELDAFRLHPALLLHRAGVVAFHVQWRWPADLAAALGRVPVAAVQKALVAALAKESLSWFALHPRDGSPEAGERR